MKVDAFREALLMQMEKKVHWAWPAFTSGLVPKDRLHIHFEQEYEVYVRDFPIFIGRAYVQCPVAAVRRELAENLYEEETGGLSAGKPHPELFLRYPLGLGFDLRRFENIELLPAARAYRSLIDSLTQRCGWSVAAAVSTLFIEGTPHERGEVDGNAPKRPVPPLEEHPLVRHYGLAVADLALTKAHRQVEGDHRGAAWRVMLKHVPADERAKVVQSLSDCVRAWSAYRDGVAKAVGLGQDAQGNPVLV